MTAIPRHMLRDHRDPVRTLTQARQDRISNWEVNYGHTPVEALGQREQASDVQRAMTAADDIRNDLAAIMEKIVAVQQVQDFDMFEDVSNDVDGSLANFVHTIGKVYEAMEQAGVPARRG